MKDRLESLPNAVGNLEATATWKRIAMFTMKLLFFLKYCSCFEVLFVVSWQWSKPLARRQWLHPNANTRLSEALLDKGVRSLLHRYCISWFVRHAATEKCNQVLTSPPCLRCDSFETGFIQAIVTGKVLLGRVTVMSSLSISVLRMFVIQPTQKREIKNNSTTVQHCVSLPRIGFMISRETNP